MTVIAEIGDEKGEAHHRLCPAIDIVGINSYGGALTLTARYRQLGGKSPYILTEFGPHQNSEKADLLGAFPEPTSTEKAEIYRRILPGAVLNLASVLDHTSFMGKETEVTSTWFSMLLPDGSRPEQPMP